MYGVLLIFFTVLSLKPLFPGNIFLQIVPVMVLVVGILRFMFFRRGKIFMPIVRNKFSIYTYIIFIVIFIVSIVRTNTDDKSIVEIVDDILTVVLLNIFVYSTVSYQFRTHNSFNNQFFDVTYKIFFSPVIAILFVLLLFLYGYTFLNINQYVRGEGNAALLSAIGISFQRINIPYGDGIHPNVYNTSAGIIFTISLISLVVLDINKKIKTKLWSCIVICFLFMLLSDSRTVFLNSLVTTLVVYILVKIKMLKVLKPLVFIIPFLSYIFIFFLISVSDVEVFEALSRGKGDLETGNSRAIIWKYCNDEIVDLKPTHLIGFGESGHYGAGVSKKYAFIFGDKYDSDNIITHNSIYQVFFDVGYIGLIFYLIVLYNFAANVIFLFYQGYKVVVIYAGCFLYYNLSGITGSYFGYYHEIYFNLFLVLVLALFTFKNEYSKQTSLSLKSV